MYWANEQSDSNYASVFMHQVLQNNIIKNFALLLFGLVVLTQCAKIGSPAGGPKDEDPPIIIKADPPDSSVNFTPKKSITLSFDEFIVLKDIYQELILSPPVEGNLQALVKGKKIVVEFPEEAVFDSTTYTLGFGNAIADNNEGNILLNYEYIFSLKDYIDTLSVEGRIMNAFNFKPNEERMYVMLYKNLNDSAPLLEKPLYISRTNKEGYYFLHNLEAGTYRLFALQDLNNNMLYDMPDESIAFSDSLIELHPDLFKDDIVLNDSLLYNQLLAADTTQTDTLLIDSLRKQINTYSLYSELLFFNQVVKNQYLTDNKRERPEKLFFSFNQPLAEPLTIEALNYTISDSAWYLPDISKKNDTIIYWLTDTAMIADDSLAVAISYPVYDSLFNLELRSDTLVLRIQEEKQKNTRGRRALSDKEDTEEEGEKPPVLTIGHNIKKPSGFELNQHIKLSSTSPIASINTDRIEFVQMLDTIPVPIVFQISRDSNSMYNAKIEFRPEELTTYRLTILDSTITDIYGITNDTTLLQFRTQAEDFYGSLNITISNVTHPTIIQLMTEKEDILRQNIIRSDTIMRYEYLYAMKYLLKVIVDENNNGEWDTGNYLMNKQPEKIEYYSKEINVRSNWEIDFPWQLLNQGK